MSSEYLQWSVGLLATYAAGRTEVPRGSESHLYSTPTPTSTNKAFDMALAFLSANFYDSEDYRNFSESSSPTHSVEDVRVTRGILRSRRDTLESVDNSSKRKVSFGTITTLQPAKSKRVGEGNGLAARLRKILKVFSRE